MYSLYVKAKRFVRALTNLLHNKRAMLIAILFFFSLVSVLSIKFIHNWAILVACVDDYVGAEILAYILTLKFNINHLHLTISALTHNPVAQYVHFINVMRTAPEMLWMQYVFLYNYLLECLQMVRLGIVLPFIFTSAWLEIELDTVKWLITTGALDFSDDYLTNLINLFSLLKRFGFIIITNIGFFFFTVFTYAFDFFSTSAFFYLIKFIFLQIWNLIQLIPVRDFFLFFINFVKYILYVVLVNCAYLYETIMFLKICIISFGWKLLVAWLLGLKTGFFAFLDSFIPKPLAQIWLTIVYTPIMATYYFFKFFWVRYISIGVDYTYQTLVDPFTMFNEFMLYFTTDVKPTPRIHDNAMFPKIKRLYKSYRFFMAQMPSREFSRNIWFVYPFIFLYTLLNSTAELIYEYCVEVQDYVYDIYEIYLINYGLLYQAFDDYFFNAFLFYFFLTIGSILEAPVYIIDYFMAKPDTDFAGHPYVFFDWFSASKTIYYRWVYFKAYPLQTHYLIFLSLLTDLVPVYKTMLISYYNTIVYNEFLAFYDFYFNSNFFFWFRSTINHAFEYTVELVFQIFFIFSSILNFMIKSLQIHLFLSPIGFLMILFSIPKTLFYFGFYFNPIIFAQNFSNEFSALYFILKDFLLNAVQQGWFVNTYFRPVFLSLANFVNFFLGLFSNFHFMLFKFLPILIFELFKFINLVLINPFSILLSLLLSSLVLTNFEYFSNTGLNANFIISKFSTLGFIPVVYINVYFLSLLVLILCLYVFLFKKFFQMIVYFRLGGVLMEVQTLMDIFNNSSVGRLYYIMHFNEVQIKQTTTALAKERKPRKLVKLFYRKWFGAGHNHFIDYRWRILQSNFWGWRRFKMQYFLKKNRFGKPLRTDTFFYNPLDYIKHIRMLFFRFYYSAIRVYDINTVYYASQFNYERSASGIEYLHGMGRFRPLHGRLIKPIPKYWFPIFSYMPVFFGRTDIRKFRVQKRFIAFKYIFIYGFPSYLLLSNLLWWFHFIMVYSLPLLFRLIAQILVFMGKRFFNFFRKK